MPARWWRLPSRPPACSPSKAASPARVEKRPAPLVRSGQRLQACAYRFAGTGGASESLRQTGLWRADAHTAMCPRASHLFRQSGMHRTRPAHARCQVGLQPTAAQGMNLSRIVNESAIVVNGFVARLALSGRCTPGDYVPRILVIDDDDLVRTAVQQMLENKGFDVVVAAQGEHALRILDDGNFDAIVVDIFMPDMDGLETIRAFRERSPEIAIVAMSGTKLRGDGRRAGFPAHGHQARRQCQPAQAVPVARSRCHDRVVPRVAARVRGTVTNQRIAALLMPANIETANRAPPPITSAAEPATPFVHRFRRAAT